MGFPRVITISHCVSRDVIKGHPYWFHKCVDDAAKAFDVTHITCGPRDQSSSRIQGVLEHPGHFRSASSIFVFWGMKAEISRLEEILSQDSDDNLIHIYEGGFREFILARIIARRNPRVTVLFNFNLTDPWHLVFDKKTLSARVARLIMKRCIVEIGPRLAPFAETKETADRFSEALGIEFSQYPLFSTVNAPEAVRKNKVRKFDVTFFPADALEMSQVLQTIVKLTNVTLLTILVVPRWGLEISPSDSKWLKRNGVQYLEQILGGDEYRNLYTSTKIAVFPYEGPYYLNTSSGRVLDAAAAGCYCVAPNFSSPGKQIERNGWGSAYADLSQEINSALREWPEFKSQHVPSVENTLSTLVEVGVLLRAKKGLNHKKKPYIPDVLLFASLFFGTGFRSWAPRIFQALDMLLKSRLVARRFRTRH